MSDEYKKGYKHGYADAMNWKVQNHLEHLPVAQPELTLDGLTPTEFALRELYEFQEATGCDTAAEFKTQPEQEPVAWLQFRDNEPPVVAPRDLGTPVFLGIRGGLAHDAGEKP